MWCPDLFYENNENNSVENVMMQLYRSSFASKEKESRVTFTLGVKANDGSVYKSAVETCTFKSNNSEQPVYIVKMHELLENRSRLEYESFVTFFCTIHFNEKSGFIAVDILGKGQHASSNGKQQTFSDKGQQTSSDEEPCTSSNTKQQTFSEKEQQTSSDEGQYTSSERGQQAFSDNGLHSLSQDLKNLFLRGDNSDATIKVRGKDFNVHSPVLAARSPVFAAMFSHDMKEKRSRTVDIDDCDSKAFVDLMYVYSGQMQNISSDNVIDLYCAAEKYDMQELRVKCSEYMKDTISVDNFCDIISLAIRYDDSGLIQYATRFFLENVEEIIVTIKWLSFAKDYPVQANELFVKTIKRSSFK